MSRKLLYLVLAIGVMLLFAAAILGGAATYSVVTGHDINRKLCVASKLNRDGVRNILIYLRDRNVQRIRAEAPNEEAADKQVSAYLKDFDPLFDFVPEIKCGGTQDQTPEQTKGG